MEILLVKSHFQSGFHPGRFAFVKKMENYGEILKSSRGGDVLLFGGYMYSLNRLTEDTYYWECKYRNKTKKEVASCSARLNSRLRDNRHLVCSTVKDHTHAPDTSEVAKVRLRMELTENSNEVF
ncbi:uncharacterized protein LOC128093509 [Culex pipiens pallens]|uniref:uncharacterized protein LOC128093509 n=1 Tax=Culex pipiens pallens TaxID=42434 RepID=UPI0022AACD7C|nr:uncharacterized protein LOC128093509 [Culex pipiens pallens]